jgi:hypothetical protein
MAKMITRPDKLAYTIMRLRFPFLRDVCERHGELVQDVYQIGWLCYYESGGRNKEFWNHVQRELYMLSKALGFRRTRRNNWWKREQSFSSFSEERKEVLQCSLTGQ